MEPDILKLLKEFNLARQEGLSREDIDAVLGETPIVLPDGGSISSLDQLTAAVRALPPDRPRAPVRTRDILAAEAQGALFNFFDELAGAATATAGRPVSAGEDPRSLAEQFAAGREPVREATERFREERPGVSLISELIGGFAVPGVGGERALARGSRGGGGLLRRLGRQTAIGAGAGAVAGAGEAETLADVPRTALRGAGGGAVAGGLLSGAAEVLTRGVPAVGRQALGIVAPEAAGRAAARRQIREAATRAGLTPQDIEGILASMEARRPGLAVPADVTGTFQREVRANINEAAGDVERTIQQVQGRVEGAGDRLADDVRRLSNFGDESAEVAQAAASRRLADVGEELLGPLDDIHPRVFQDEGLQEFLRNPDVAAAWRKVRPRGGKNIPRFRHFQALRNELGDDARALSAQGRTAGSRNASQLRDQLTVLLEDLAPGFRAANRGYAQQASTVRAFDAGALAIKRRLGGTALNRSLQESVQAAGDLGPEAAEAFRHGMVDEFILDILKQPRGRNVGRQFTRLGQERADALRAVFPSEEAFIEFMERALIEDRFSGLQRVALGNSTTPEQMVDILRSMRVATVWSPVAGMLNWLARPNPAVARARATELAQLLLTPGEQNVKRLLEVLSEGIAPGAAAAVTDALTIGVQPALQARQGEGVLGVLQNLLGGQGAETQRSP